MKVCHVTSNILNVRCKCRQTDIFVLYNYNKKYLNSYQWKNFIFIAYRTKLEEF